MWESLDYLVFLDFNILVKYPQHDLQKLVKKSQYVGA